MDTHCVDVLDEADGDHLVLAVADDLQLELFPAEHRLLHEDLPHETRAKTTVCDIAKLLHVVDESTARAPHRVGRPNDTRQSDVGHDPLGFFQAVGDFATRHLDAELVHRVLEGLSVLTSLDRVDLNPDHPNAVLFQNARTCEL
jgi:hypothetical protein